MDELVKEFDADKDTSAIIISGIKILFKLFSFEPNTLVSDIADKLRKNKLVQEEYKALCTRFLSLKKLLDNLDHTSCFKITPENAESDLIKTGASKVSIIEQLEAQQKALELKQEERSNFEEAIKRLAINELPQKILVINNKNEQVFETAPDLAATLKFSASLKATLADKLAFTTKMLSVLKENEAYFQKVYDDIFTEIISPLKKELLPLNSQTYSKEAHILFSSALSALERVNFSAGVKQQDIPHAEYAKASTTIQKSFSDALDELKKELTENIIAKQKECFSSELTQRLKNREIEFKALCEKLSIELALKTKEIDECKGDEKKLDTLQTFYNECADSLKEQSNPKKLVEKWVTENNLQNDVAIQRLLAEFYTGETYISFCSSIEKLTKPVETVIGEGKIAVESANTAKIEKLKAEAEAQAQTITEYKTAFDKVSQSAKELEGLQQVSYQKEKANLDKINRRLNRRLQRREKLTNALGIYKIPFDTSAPQLQTILRDEATYQPIKNSLETLTASEKELRKSIEMVTAEYDLEQQDYKKLTDLSSQIAEAFKEEKETSKKEKFVALVTSLSGSNISNALFEQSACEKVIALLQERVKAWTLLWADENEKKCQDILKPYIEKQKNALEELVKQKEGYKKVRADTISDTKKTLGNYSHLKTRDAGLLKLVPGAQTAEKALQDLRTVQAEEIQKIYAELSIYLPEKTVVPEGKEYPFHRKNLDTMICDHNLRNAKLRLFELKGALNSALTSLAALDVKSAAFQYNPNTPDEFAKQWETHAQQFTTAATEAGKTILTVTTKLTEAEAAIADLTKALNSAEQLLSKTEEEARAAGLLDLERLFAALATKNAI